MAERCLDAPLLGTRAQAKGESVPARGAAKEGGVVRASSRAHQSQRSENVVMVIVWLCKSLRVPGAKGAISP